MGITQCFENFLSKYAINIVKITRKVRQGESTDEHPELVSEISPAFIIVWLL